MANKTIGKKGSELGVEFYDVLRRVTEFVAILTEDEFSLLQEERAVFVLNLRECVQDAYRMMSSEEFDFSPEEAAGTLDEALRVLNSNGFFGSIARVHLSVI